VPWRPRAQTLAKSTREFEIYGNSINQEAERADKELKTSLEYTQVEVRAPMTDRESSPHFSPIFVARRPRRRTMLGFWRLDRRRHTCGTSRRTRCENHGRVRCIGRRSRSLVRNAG